MILMLLSAVMGQMWAANDADTLPDNRFFWGVSAEETCWLEDLHEWYPRLSTEALVPCGNHFSIGVYAATVFLEWEAGAIASWRFHDQSRLLFGVGYSAAYDSYLVRLGYKTRRQWYFTSTLGIDTSSPEVNLGLGVGYAILGGRRK